MAFQGNHYHATFTVGSDSGLSVEVYARDNADARNKVLILYPSATNIVVSDA